MTQSVTAVPTDIRRLGKSAIEILWSDGHRSEFTNHYLRQHCPCATCRERPPRALPVVGAGGTELYPTQIGVVGRYAISIQWSDGHDAGIYSYRTLRELCPCPQCRPARPVSEGAAS
jgi:DUF971 family protein